MPPNYIILHVLVWKMPSVVTRMHSFGKWVEWVFGRGERCFFYLKTKHNRMFRPDLTHRCLADHISHISDLKLAQTGLKKPLLDMKVSATWLIIPTSTCTIWKVNSTMGLKRWSYKKIKEKSLFKACFSWEIDIKVSRPVLGS